MKGICLTICAVSLLTGAVGYLCRGWSCEQAVRLVCAAVCAVAVWQAAVRVPLFETGYGTDPQTVAPDVSFAAYTTNELVKTVLDEAGLVYTDVTSCVDISDTGHIHISKVLVVSRAEADRIRAVVEATVQTQEVEIVYG